MPLVDMPLEKLKVYGGKNPRPADFDRYWSKAIAAMKAVKPKVELVPHETGASYAECFDMYFTGVGGARVHAQLLRPKGKRRKGPALLMFHGYSGSAGAWTPRLAYVAQGFTVAALDCRGQGGLSEDVGGTVGNTLNGHIIRGLADSPDKLLFRSIYLDCAQLAGLVMAMPQVDARRVGATGGSQGGGLTLACAALEPRIARAAPVFPFLCDYRRVWEMDLAKAAYDELQKYFRLFDPLHEREDETFLKLGYIDCQHLAPRIKAKVQFCTALMDTVCPPSTQFAAYNKITAEKELVIYPDFGHEGLPGHDDRIFEFMADL